MDFAIKMFQDGGNLMYVNLAVAVFGLAVVVERFMSLNKLRINEVDFFKEIEAQVRAGNIERAVAICAKSSHAAVAQVVKAGLATATKGRIAASGAIDEAAADAMPAITKRAGVLFGIANLATLIGLVGTVFGLIESFESISLAAPDKKSEMLTSGIAHAMSNTAFGLSIAMTCVLFHMVISGQARGLMQAVERAVVRTENLVHRIQHGSEA